MNAIAEIELLVKSRYPLIYIVSWEEERVEAALMELAVKMEKELAVWTLTDGIVMKNQSIKGTESPLKALEFARTYSGKALFLFKDFHSYMEEPCPPYLENPVHVRRKLRDTIQAVRRSFKTLLVCSPVLRIPPELEKDITIIDFPLPTAAEIDSILTGILKGVQKTHRIQVELDRALRERFVKAALGLTEHEVVSVFSKAIVNDRRFDENDIELVISEKKQILRKTGLLEYYDVNEEFADVGGLENLKRWLMKRINAFSDEARKFGLPEPRGILLLGVQGCGKSLVSKAIAALWKMPLLRFDVGAIFGKYVGQSEENLRKALKVAETLAPAILWMDEIEKGFSGAGGSSEDSGVTARIFGTFLTWMQEKTAPVFVVATANSIENLPPELLRKGRFDEIFFVDLPSFAEREMIASIHIRRRGRDVSKFDTAAIARASEGFSGAEIEQAVIAGLYDAYGEKRELTTEDIIRAIKDTVPLSRTMKENIDYLREWAATRARPASLELLEAKK